MNASAEQRNSADRSLWRSIAQGSAIGVVLPIVGVVKGIVLIPILLSALGEHAYGIYVLTATGVGYALIAAGFGLDSSIYRFAPAHLATDGGRSTLSACLAVGAFSGGLVVIASLLVYAFYPLEEAYRPLPLIVGAICLLQAFWSVCLALQRARDRMLWLVTVTVLFNVLEFAIYVIAALVWHDVVAMFTGVLALNALWVGVWLAYQVRQTGISVPVRRETAAVAAFGGHTVVNTLIAGAFLTVDKFLLGIAAAPAVLAFYAPATGLAQVLGSLASLSLISVPHLLARAHDARQKDDVRTILRYGLTIYYTLAAPAVLGLIVTAEPVLTYLIGAPLAEKGAPIAVTFVIALFVLGLQRFPAQYLRVCGQSAWINFVSAVALALYAVGLFAALLLGADLPYVIPVVYLVVTLAQTALVWNRARRLAGSDLQLSDLAVPTVLAAAVVAPGLLLDLYEWPVLVAYVAVAALVYTGLMAVRMRSGTGSVRPGFPG